MAEDLFSFEAQLQALVGQGGDGIASKAQQAASAAASGPMVWMGAMTKSEMKNVAGWRVPDDGPRRGPTKPSRQPISMEDALGQPWFWEEKKWQAMYKRASLATGKTINNRFDFLSVWESAVKLASQSWEATGGKKALTPYDVFDLMARETAGAIAAEGALGPKTSTSKVTSINRLSDGSAWQLLKSAAQNALGREPTHEELRSFASRTNQIAAENPDVTTTTTTTDAEGNSTSKVSNKPGANQADYVTAAEEDVDTEEAGAYQAATTYYDALVRGIGSVV